MVEEQQKDRILCLSRQNMAILLMIVGPALYSMGFLYSNQHKLHPVTSALFRGVTVVFITYLISRHQGIDLTFKSSHNYKWLLIRNSIMIFQGLVYAWSQFYLPLPIAVTLQSTTPIFASIFDKLLNNIDLNFKQRIWLLVAFLGVVLTSNGAYIHYLLTGTTTQDNSSFENYKTKDPLMMLYAALVLLFVQFLHGYGVVITKRLKDQNSIHINYHQGLMIGLSAAFLFPYGYADSSYHVPTVKQTFLTIILLGLPITLGQLFFIGALTLSHNYGVLTPIMFTAIIFGYMVSVFRYGQSVNVICLIGAVAIVLGIVFIVRCKDKN